MFVRIRDLISAFILLPLCFAGGMLAAFCWTIVGALASSATAPDAPSTYGPQGASASAVIVSSLFTLVFALGIPAFYLYRYKTLKASNPNAIVFGEVTLGPAFVLGLIAFIGPAIGMLVLLVMFG